MVDRQSVPVPNPVVLLPTYNNSGTLPDILQRLARLNLPTIVIDDGSTDATAQILADWPATPDGARFSVLRHPVNQGKAAALQTGFAAAIRDGYTHAVTIDSDGQLDPEQIPDLLAAAQRAPEALVLGARDIRRSDYPVQSRLGRRLSNLMIRLECGRWILDSQCGLRVYPVALIQRVQCRAGGFGFETEIITQAARAGVPIVEVSVNCRYFAGEERITHFKPLRDSTQALALHARLLLPCPNFRTWFQGERFICLLLFLVAFVLRLGYAWFYRFDSDEPQHLHVAWGWAHGLMQYRDIFDNHSPLFHLLCALPVRWLGDRPDLLVIMRLLMFPIFALTLWGAWRIARNLFTPRQALWMATLAALFPPFFISSTEFRTDDPWAMVWILALAVLTAPRLGLLRGVLAGLLLGAAIGISMKTSLLLACLLAALAATAYLYRQSCPPRTLARRYGPTALAALAGMLVIPGALVAWFYAHDALGPLYYGVIGHNLLPNMGHAHDRFGFRKISFVVICLALCLLCRRAIRARAAGAAPLAPAKVVLFLFTGFYLTAIYRIWPLITQEDFIPVWPLVVILAVAIAKPGLAGPDLTSRRTGARWMINHAPRPCLWAAAFELLILAVPLSFFWWRGSALHDRQRWQAVLTLTTPQDTVLDPKGELIFRNRPIYWGLEKITRDRMKRDLIQIDIKQRLIDTHTCVVYPLIYKYPELIRKFITANYQSIGPLLVVGRALTINPKNPAQPITFQIKIPAEYTVVTPSGVAQGLLDGHPCPAGQYLAAGPHTYGPAPGETSKLVLLWREAVEHHYQPVSLGKG